jgi:polyisoprenoid-binding protein YceI
MTDVMTVAEGASRTYDGVEFPAAGTWTLDPTHTRVDFEARHLMVAKVKGHFGGPEGALVIAEDPTLSTAEVRIATATIDTGVEQRDEHLKSPDFLEVEKYPELTFSSTSFEHVKDEQWILHGDLVIHGVSRPVKLETEYSGQTIDPWGGTRAFFSAVTKIDREDWGLSWNVALETGGWLVGKEIKLAIEVEAVLEQD